MDRTHRADHRALRERRPRREAAQGTVTAVARPRNAPPRAATDEEFALTATGPQARTARPPGA